MTNTKQAVFAGQIVTCTDLDSRDQFNIEVLINVECPIDKLDEACERAAKKHELVLLSGNSFEFEHVMDSGRRIQTIVTTERTELVPRSKDAEDALNEMSHG